MAAMANPPLLKQLSDVSTTDARKRCGGVPHGLAEGLKEGMASRQGLSSTDERLRDSIARRMRMSHVYQPLMLMELLGRRSPAPAQDVARRILGEDVTQIEVYTERVKRMVGKVHLQRHHPLRARHRRPGERRGAERRRARRTAATVPPTP